MISPGQQRRIKNYRLFPLTSPPASQSRHPTPHGPRRLDRRALPDHAQPSGPGPDPVFLVCVDHTPSDRPRLDIVDSGAAQEANQLAEMPFSQRQLFPSCWPYLFPPAATAALLVCLCVCSGPSGQCPQTLSPPLLQEPRVVETFPGSTTAPNQEASGSVTSSSIASCKPPANRIPFQPPIPFILFSLQRAEPTASARLGCSVVVVNSSNHAPGRNPLLRAMLP